MLRLLCPSLFLLAGLVSTFFEVIEMKNFYEAIRLALDAAIHEYKFVRFMQRGYCPDELPF